MNLTIGDYVNTFVMGWDEFNWTVEQFQKAGAPVGGNCLYIPKVGESKRMLLWDGMSLHHTTDRNQGSKERDVTAWMHAEWRAHCAEQVPVTEEEEQAWQEKEDERMNIIARNGNDGDHYWEKPLKDRATREQMQELVSAMTKKTETSDGSTASYYELPPGATQLQHLISHRNMNAQVGEIFRACYRYGQASHSDQLRDAKKIAFYANAEIERLEALK